MWAKTLKKRLRKNKKLYARLQFLRANLVVVIFVALFASVGLYAISRSLAATGNDLTVTALTMSPTNPTAGQAVTFSATVKNIGTTATPAGTVVGVSFTVDGTKVTWNETDTTSLAAGVSVTLAATTGTSGATWTATTGPHTVVATADDTNAIPDELNEANNTMSSTFTVGATGSLYVTPATNSVLVGNNLTVSVRLNPGTTVDGVTMTLTYDTSKLQFVSADDSASPFTTVLTAPTASGSTVTATLGSLSGGVSSDALITTLTFRALVGSGSTPLTITGNATKDGAYTDPSTTNSTVSFTAPDTTPPLVSITAPLANAVLLGSQTVTVTASDNVGVSRVELYIDGVLKGTDTSAPYSFSVDTTTLTNGVHTYTAKAYDAAGNIGTSTGIVATVKNLAEDINQDGLVNIQDFSLLSAKFGQSGSGLGRVDINGDGKVDLADFSLLASYFGD